jgi:flagellar protein FlaG
MSSEIHPVSSAIPQGRPAGADRAAATQTASVSHEAVAPVKLALPKSSDIKFDPNKARENLSGVINMLNKQMESTQRGLGFSYDDSKKTPVVKVTDVNSGEVVRQIPSEDAIKMAHHIDQFKGLLYNNKA